MISAMDTGADKPKEAAVAGADDTANVAVSKADMPQVVWVCVLLMVMCLLYHSLGLYGDWKILECAWV